MSASRSANDTGERDDPVRDTELAPDTDLALDTDLGWAIRMVSTAFRRVATDSVADLPGGARGYLCLVALAGGEPPSQLALARAVNLDRTVMTYLLDDLEAHQLVTRSPDPRDRRARQVVLTDTGRARLDHVRRSLAAAEARLLTDLDEREAHQLRTLLARVARTAHRNSGAPIDGDC